MAYRNDLEALEARHHALEAEVAERVKARDEIATMLREAREGDAAERHFARLADRRQGRRTRLLHHVVAIALVLGVAIAALAGGIFEVHHDHRHQQSARFASAMAYMQLFAGEMCECKTETCVKQISDTMTKWSEAHIASEPLDPLTPDELARATKVGQHMAECMVRAMTPPPATDEVVLPASEQQLSR